MRYPASEKLEIIRLAERSHLPAKQMLDMLSIRRTTFIALCCLLAEISVDFRVLIAAVFFVHVLRHNK